MDCICVWVERVIVNGRYVDRAILCYGMFF